MGWVDFTGCLVARPLGQRPNSFSELATSSWNVIWSLFATLSDFWDACRSFQHSNASFTYISLTILCQELTYEVKYIQCQFLNFDFTRAWVLNNALNKHWHRVTHEFNHQFKRRKRKKMIKGVMMMMMICNTLYQNQSKFCKSKLCTIAEKCDYLGGWWWYVILLIRIKANLYYKWTWDYLRGLYTPWYVPYG